MIKLQIIGRVGKDPDVKTVNGKQVANFSVAHTQKSQQGETTVWVEVALWDKPNVYPHIRKGGMVYIEGSPSVNAYSKSDGTAAASLRLSAYNIELLGGAKQAEAQQEVETAPLEVQDGLPF